VEDHVSPGLFDIALVNSNFLDKLPNGVEWVRVEEGLSEEYRIYQADLVDALYPWRHDSEKLARAVMDLYLERTGPLVESSQNLK
jgi:hypothetical protein